MTTPPHLALAAAATTVGRFNAERCPYRANALGAITMVTSRIDDGAAAAMDTSLAMLVFTKGTGKHDQLDAIRADGSTLSLSCPKQRIIPHEMVHYAVETTLCKRGFVTRMVEFAIDVDQPAPAPESDAVERLVEVLQADGWSDWSGLPADLLELYQTTCTARACAPLHIRHGDIVAIRDRIVELTMRWEAVPTRGCLKLTL